MKSVKICAITAGLFLFLGILFNVAGCSPKANTQNKDERNFGQSNISENDMREMIRSNPKNVMAYCGLGNTFIQKREFDKAIKIFQEAITVSDTNPEVYVGLGNVYSQKGDVEKSAYFLNKALSLDGSNANAYFMLGLLYFNKPEFSAEMPKILEKLDLLNKELANRLRDIYLSTKR